VLVVELEDRQLAVEQAGGEFDTFVSRFSADLIAPIKSTYLGGASDDEPNGMAIHPVSGDIYVAGFTSSFVSFPDTTGSAQPGYGGGIHDAYVSRLSADLTKIIKSTYLGGMGMEQAYAVAIHPVITLP
jgi:DNA-binding beta-propeller fold protein YncE